MSAGVVELAERFAKRQEALSNPYRALILAGLINKHEASWKDLKLFLEGIFEEVNPNTLSFHLNRLIGEGLVEKVTETGSGAYRPTAEGKRMLMKLGAKLVKAVGG